MRDLNAAEIVELEGLTVEFVRDRALDGMACIVILVGRGHSYVGYAEEISEKVPDLLERAYRTALKHSGGTLN